MQKPFKQRVLEVVRSIPKGEMRTYKEVAEAAGSPRAFRAVGSLMKQNLDPDIPCHRVIKSDGSPGQYNRSGGTAAKIARLKEEGALS